ncbi:MAG: ATP synthase F1 subunit gamma [Deltaproteobacteria bacterium]|nr:ATP synthase F1 subunit gamma [Deltaproteobacteria bacterium]
MATLKVIRRRVSSVRNIQQITKAMKMVSAARLRRAQEAAIAARPYAEKLEAVLQNLATQGQSLSHPLLTAREEQHIDLLLVTSDRGLCGGFNSNLVRAAEAFIRSHPNQKVTITIVGRRGYDYFKRRPVEIGDHHINLFGRLTPALANEIGTRLSQRFVNGETDGVYVLYARFRSALVQIPTIDHMLPIIPKERAADAPSSSEYLYEPQPQELLESLLTRYIDMLIYRAMLESVASEHGARMTAMDNATSNAVEMIDRLTLDMNRARQASITRELLEIVSTSESLKG